LGTGKERSGGGIISHAHCLDCGAIISCGDGGCSRCDGKIVSSDLANANIHWGRCDECFKKLPEGTKSEFIESFEKKLSETNEKLGYINRQIHELEEKREKLLAHKKAFERVLKEGKLAGDD